MDQARHMPQDGGFYILLTDLLFSEARRVGMSVMERRMQ
jgi:hypothetical protein